jgi:alpha-glucuronidase
MHPMDAAHTSVDVTYARTALRPEADEHVLSLGKHDSEQGKEWGDAINAYLQRRRGRAQ